MGPCQRSPIVRSIAPGSSRRERDQSLLAALADDRQGAVTALDAERLDVRADRLGDPQAFRASSVIRACSAGLPSPAATSSPPASLRSARSRPATSALTTESALQPDMSPGAPIGARFAEIAGSVVDDGRLPVMRLVMSGSGCEERVRVNWCGVRPGTWRADVADRFG
jgi:hypothetical protein